MMNECHTISIPGDEKYTFSQNKRENLYANMVTK
jgi:hypothetical protein